MKKKISVIGGGLGSMTAVYQLMRLPGSKDLYDITLYQMGWQLGGKGASGVNLEKGYRVEEHGIHYWFGFYENAFRMMKEIYSSLDRPPSNPVRTFEDAFKPQGYMDFAQKVDGEWTDWTVEFPKLPGTVGDGKFINPIEEVLEVGLRMMAEEFHKILQHLSNGCLGNLLTLFKGKPTPPKHPTHESYLNKFEQELADDLQHPIERRLLAMAHVLKDPEHHGSAHKTHHATYIHSLRQYIWDLIGDMVHKHPVLLRVWCTIDFGMAMLHGVIEDEVLFKQDDRLHLDFSKINDHDYKGWLILHGADKKYLTNFPAVQSMYDGPFAIFQGAVNAPNIEAGTALNIFFRLAFSCKEDVIWKMQGGMGDIVFAPIYQLLKKDFPENVHFKYFHKAVGIEMTDDEASVSKLILENQIPLKEGLTEYEPLVDVKGFPSWPSAPLVDQLDPAKAGPLKEDGNSLTSDWTEWKGKQVVLEKGKDFDEIVLGCSLASLPKFCQGIIASKKPWADMLNNVATVQTQAFQLWLTEDPKELGVKDSKFLSTYVEPLDTYSEMNQTLNREDWSNYDNPPKYLLYVCGAMKDSENIPPNTALYFPDNQKELVYKHMTKYVKEHLRFVLPGAFNEDGSFKWEILFDPENREGEDRLRFQYYRANIDSSERYVYSVVGSSKHRLKTDETGLSNLYLTGDWIQNGMNIGFVEGATISGLLTARAISGEDIPIFLPW